MRHGALRFLRRRPRQMNLLTGSHRRNDVCGHARRRVVEESVFAAGRPAGHVADPIRRVVAIRRRADSRSDVPPPSGRVGHGDLSLKLTRSISTSAPSSPGLNSRRSSPALSSRPTYGPTIGTFAGMEYFERNVAGSMLDTMA